jgi:hypothetical protein
MMYRIRWEIDVAAGSSRKAAQTALKIQRDRQSTATVFDVIPAEGKRERVDLKPTTAPMLVCDNCGRRYRSAGTLQHAFPDIPDLLVRIESGGVVPAGECNDCGALVYG